MFGFAHHQKRLLAFGWEFVQGSIKYLLKEVSLKQPLDQLRALCSGVSGFPKNSAKTSHRSIGRSSDKILLNSQNDRALTVPVCRACSTPRTIARVII